MFILNGFQDIGLLILRIALGIIFVYHGKPKIFGGKTMAIAMGKPSWGGFLTFLGCCETLGGLATILGALTQFASIGFILVMLGALNLKINQWKVPFFAYDKTGWKFDFLILCCAITLVLLGAGHYSVDAYLAWWP